MNNMNATNSNPSPSPAPAASFLVEVWTRTGRDMDHRGERRFNASSARDAVDMPEAWAYAADRCHVDLIGTPVGDRGEPCEVVLVCRVIGKVESAPRALTAVRGEV